MLSSLTHTRSDSTFTRGYRCANSFANLQCEVALFPLSKPASARRNDATQTDPKRLILEAMLLSQAKSSASRAFRVATPQTSNNESKFFLRFLKCVPA